MPNIVSLDQCRRRRLAQPHTYQATPIDRSEHGNAGRQSAREALQEAIFALQITHAQTSIVIEDIEDKESREALRAQSERICSLIDLAWCRLGDI